MPTLEEELVEVRSWCSDLSATHVVQQEEGHWEAPEMKAGVDYDPKTWIVYGDPKDEWVIDKPEQREPDMYRREQAQEALQDRYERSSWHSVKYTAARALGVDEKTLNDHIVKWTADLARRLKATRTEAVKVGEHEEEGGEGYTNRGWGDRDSGGYAAWGEKRTYTVDDYEDRTVEDMPTQCAALEDAAALFHASGADPAKDLLTDTYRHNNFSALRRQAGEALGYSRPRIWAHEHPLLLGLGVTAAVAYAVYALVH